MEEAKKYLLSCAKLNGRPVGEGSLSQEVRVWTCTREYTGMGGEFLSERPSFLGPPYRTSSPVESSRLRNTPPGSGGSSPFLAALLVYSQPRTAEDTEKQREHTGS